MDATLQLGAACSDLGFRMYRHLDGEGNRAFSPISIASVLAALLAGARGSTAEELAEALGVGASEAGALGALLAALGDRRATESVWDDEQQEIVEAEVDHFILRIANALFVQEAYPVHDEYRQRLQAELQSEIVSLDFAQREDAASAINTWVANETEERITDLIDPDALTDLTRIIPTNAVYFLAPWLNRFEDSCTRPMPFHVDAIAGSPTVEVPMMHQIETFGHFADTTLGFEAARLPYRAMSMIVIRPDAGRLKAVEDALGLSLLQRIAGGLSYRLLEMGMPRFEFESTWSLGEALKALGVRRAFDLDTAEFGGISDHPEGLYVSEIIHQANVRVDEQGTEAAAATAVMMAGCCEEPEPPVPHPFILDRPFLFVIWDDETETVLFLGRVMNPKA